MCDIRGYPSKFITEFLDLYKSLPALWKIKSSDYSDRNKKNAGYHKMIEKLREVEPNASREMVIKKINSLRSSRRKEYKRVQKSLKSGAGADDVYVPSLWYYNQMTFLDNQETPRQPVSNFDETFFQDETDDVDSVAANSPAENRPPSQSSASNNMPNRLLSETDDMPPFSVMATARGLPPRRHNSHMRKRKIDDALTTIEKRLNETKREDSCDVFGKYIAYKLKNMPIEHRIFAEKKIYNVIFEAELGLMTTSKINACLNSNVINNKSTKTS